MPEVPKQIFAKFFDELTAAGMPDDLIGALRKAILDQPITESAVKAALSPAKTP